MHLLSYDQFAKLRLRDFAPPNVAIGEASDWEWLGARWFNEGVGFTSFSRPLHAPEETGGLEVSFPAFPADSSQRLLVMIGLPLRPGMSASEVLTALGTPTATHLYVPDRHTYDFVLGSPDSYRIGCTITARDGLVHVSVVREDILSRIGRAA
jgi:hypothetical protein